MKSVLFIGILLALILALAVCRDNGRLREELRQERARKSQPWDWTREGEKKAKAALELICDKCHEPYRCAQNELDEACAMCAVPDAVYRLATGTEGRIATAASALPHNDSEEVRG